MSRRGKNPDVLERRRQRRTRSGAGGPYERARHLADLLRKKRLSPDRIWAAALAGDPAARGLVLSSSNCMEIVRTMDANFSKEWWEDFAPLPRPRMQIKPSRKMGIDMESLCIGVVRRASGEPGIDGADLTKFPRLVFDKKKGRDTRILHVAYPIALEMALAAFPVFAKAFTSKSDQQFVRSVLKRLDRWEMPPSADGQRIVDLRSSAWDRVYDGRTDRTRHRNRLAAFFMEGIEALEASLRSKSSSRSVAEVQDAAMGFVDADGLNGTGPVREVLERRLIEILLDPEVK